MLLMSLLLGERAALHALLDELKTAFFANSHVGMSGGASFRCPRGSCK